MKVKKWVTKTQKNLIVQGTKLDEKAEIPVAMITTDSHNSGRVKNSDRGTYQGNKGNKKRQQDRRNGRNQNQTDGQNVGQDFFPTEIATFKCGLKISMQQIKLHNKKQYLGFSAGPDLV